MVDWRRERKDVMAMAAGNTPGDPFFSSVMLIASMTGANNQTTQTKLAGTGNFTCSFIGGGAFITTAVAGPFANSSAFCSPSPAELDWSATGQSTAGDFTWEYWAKAPSAAATGFTLFAGADILHNAGVLHSNSAAFADVPFAEVATTAWTHYAVCRAVGTLRCFAAGVQTGSVAYGGTIAWNFIGLASNASVGTNYTGNIGPIRLTAAARYTANFTPPTAMFPTS